MRNTSKLHALSLVVFVCFFSLMAHAQYRTSIQGVVTDPTGAVISGAKITLTNPATGEEQIRNSDSGGVYNFNALPAAAHFNLKVEKDGFQTRVIDNLELIPDQANALNLQLAVGAASQTIQVNAQSTPLRSSLRVRRSHERTAQPLAARSACRSSSPRPDSHSS